MVSKHLAALKRIYDFVDDPNRFNIPLLFELHVWAWRDNPQGGFVDCNHDN
jgi:hypothetical protein